MVTLRQAVAEVIRIQGLEILDAPERFVGSVTDFIGTEAVEANVLLWCCDQQYLGWFTQGRGNMSPEELASACRAAESYLHQDRGVDETVAHNVSLGIAQGMADVAHVDLEPYVQERPQQVTGDKGDVLAEERQRNQVHTPPTDATAPMRQVQQEPQTPQPPVRRTGLGKVVGVVAAIALVCVGAMVAFCLITGRDLPFGLSKSSDASSDSNEAVELVQPNIVKEDFKSTDADEKVILLTVRNAAPSTVDLHATITFLDDDGDVKEEKECDAWSVGPGETTLLEQFSDASGVVKASYNVTATAPKYGKTSLLSCVSIEELTNNSNGLTVRVTNKSDKDVTIVSCVGYGYDDKGSFAYIPVSYGGSERTLGPGEGRNVVFEGDAWSSLTYKVYVYGYAE